MARQFEVGIVDRNAANCCWAQGFDKYAATEILFFNRKVQRADTLRSPERNGYRDRTVVHEQRKPVDGRQHERK